MSKVYTVTYKMNNGSTTDKKVLATNIGKAFECAERYGKKHFWWHTIISIIEFCTVDIRDRN